MKKGKTRTSAPVISIIVVQYHAEKILLECLTAIHVSQVKVPYEIIVVDNSPTISLEKKLQKLFPGVVYVQSPENKGYGGGVNLGVHEARGEYLCLMNPDITIPTGTIDKLYQFSRTKKKAGLVSAYMLDEKNNDSVLQGTQRLTPLRAIFTFSLIHRVFPHNSIAEHFWIPRKKDEEATRVSAAPIGLGVIKKSVFEKVGGFDEKFFLYYEDYDLNKRFEDAGYENYLYHNAPIIHFGGKGGTASVRNLSTIYKRSRFYYFKKHYGLIPAVLTTAFLSVSKYTVGMTGIFLLAAGLLLYRLGELMMFIGDFGWFYISARDMLITGSMPLVGIASSHPWLHQGPLWTYILAGGFALTKFHPLSGGIIAILFGLGSVFLIYKTGKEFFSENVGIIASLQYACSPLIIIHARMPYHTAPIPFFTLLLLYSVSRWIKGNPYFFPVVLFSLSVLYNLELASVVYWFAVVFLIGWGIIKKQEWIRSVITPKILTLSFGALLLPLIPVLIYDVGHGFPQTLKFAAWMGYKVLTVFGYPPLHEGMTEMTYSSLISFFGEHMRRLFFLPNQLLAIVFLVSGVSYVLFTAVSSYRKKKLNAAFAIFVLFLVAGLGGFFGAKTTSEAYLPMLFPTLMLSFALFIHQLLQFPRLRLLTIGLLVSIVLLNIYSLLQQNYLMGMVGGYGPTYANRLTASEQIVKESVGTSYTIKGKGVGSQFESFTMNTEYLTWWFGHGPQEKARMQFIISENPETVVIKKHD